MTDVQKTILYVTLALTLVLVIFNVYLLARTDLYPMANYWAEDDWDVPWAPAVEKGILTAEEVGEGKA
ncbi:hypothetical protein FQN53_009073 [Emmonsiellopsis sp. PD_33]|nr:hypothetical protein FQN53_009073 [Emmonsiellopsis sp. PD_33]KAK2799508.1 hypothetical protein FQN51_006822 [Onygenales sp. PD_10]